VPHDDAYMTPCQDRAGDFAFLLAHLPRIHAVLAGRTRACQKGD
jgi:hypothetical protein